jgi:hypothetical protein
MKGTYTLIHVHAYASMDEYVMHTFLLTEISNDTHVVHMMAYP